MAAGSIIEFELYHNRYIPLLMQFKILTRVFFVVDMKLQCTGYHRILSDIGSFLH